MIPAGTWRGIVAGWSPDRWTAWRRLSGELREGRGSEAIDQAERLACQRLATEDELRAEVPDRRDSAWWRAGVIEVSDDLRQEWADMVVLHREAGLTLADAELLAFQQVDPQTSAEREAMRIEGCDPIDTPIPPPREVWFP